MMGPPIAGSPRVQGHREYVIRTIMHGLTGPLDDRTYTNVMVPMGAQTNDWVAAIASYVRNDFGNTGSYVTPADVARVRAATAGRKTPWTALEIDKTLPVLVPSDQTWRATASHNAAAADRALTIIGWTSMEPQQPGMWVQIEMPQATRISEVQFNAPGGGRGNPARGSARPGAGRQARPQVRRRRATGVARIPGADLNRRQDVEQAGRARNGRHDNQRIVRSGLREVRADHADDGRSEPWTAGDPERPRAPTGGELIGRRR